MKRPSYLSKIRAVIISVVLSLVLADITQMAFIANPPEPTTRPVREHIVKADLPAGYRMATYLAIERVTDWTGWGGQLVVRLFHFFWLFFIFLSVFIFVGPNSLWTFLTLPGMAYGLYLHDVQYINRLTDFPETMALCYAIGLGAMYLFHKKMTWKKEILILFFLACLLAAFLRENAALILVFLGFVVGWSLVSRHWNNRSLFHLWDEETKKEAIVIGIAVLGLLAGRLLVRLVFPEVAHLAWQTLPGNDGPGNLFTDARFYAHVNFMARRQVFLDLLSQFFVFFLLLGVGLKFVHDRIGKSVVVAAGGTLLFQWGAYMFIGNMPGENLAAMAMLTCLYIPVGMALKNKWKLNIFSGDRINQQNPAN